MDLAELWASVGYFDIAIFFLLTVMFVHSWGIWVLRMWKFRAAATDGRHLSNFIRNAHSDLNLEAAIAEANGKARSPFVNLVAYGLEAFQSSPAALSNRDALDLTQRAMQRCASMTGADMKVGLRVLSTIASLAPFIGLAGTTIGIMTSFPRGHGGIHRFAANLALALLPTAAGLLVGIVAVGFGNHLAVKLERFKVDSGTLVDDVLRFVGARQHQRGSVEPVNLQPAMLTTGGPVVLLLSVWAVWLYVSWFLLWGIVWTLTHPHRY